MKRLCLFIAFFSSVCLADVSVEYRISKVHGLINFAMAISGEAHYAKGLAELFKNSSYGKSTAIQAELKKLNQIKPSLFNSLQLKDWVPGRQRGIDLNNHIIAQSIFSKNIKDLNERLLGMMALNDQIIFIEVLKKLEPVYDDLIWNKNIKELSEHKVKLEELARQVDLNTMFKKAEKFYKSTWPQDTPFVIGLYPVPFIKNFRNATSSQSLGSVEEHGVMVGAESEDLKGSFGVIFHELCHSLYQSQSKEVMIEFEQLFAKSKSEYKQQAYSWINESLATALGNGWAFELANNGHMDKTEWYNEPTIDGYGKALYPLVKKYLDRNKAIDKSFVEQAVLLFGKSFPDSIYNYDDLTNELVFIHNKSMLKQESLIYTNLNQVFTTRSLESGSPISHGESITSILANDTTVMIVYSNDEFKEIEKLAKDVKAISKNMVTISKMKNRNIFSFLDDRSKAYIFIMVSSEKEFMEALQKMKALKKMGSVPKIEEF